MRTNTLALIMFIFAESNPGVTPWYENTTIIVAFITPILGLISGIIMFKLNKWWDKKQEERREQLKRDEEEEDLHKSLFTKFAEMNKEEKAELRSFMMTLHAQEIDWYKKQLEMKDITILEEKTEAHESRLRAHSFANENTRLQNHILVLQGLMSRAGLEIPEFTFTKYTDLMLISMNDPLKREAAEKFLETQLERGKALYSSEKGSDDEKPMV